MGSLKVTPKSLFALDDSFSSYLAFVRENSFPPELANSSAVDHLACQITFNRRRSRSTPDGEIEIFDAEKYFSGVMDGSAASGRTRVPTPTAAGAKKEVRRLPCAGSRPGSTASETSYNNRSALLPDQRRRDSDGKKFLRVFPCSCARKQAINIDTDAQLVNGRPHDEHSVPESRLKRISPSFRRQEPFSLPPNPISKFKPEEKELIGVAQNAILGANFTSKSDLAIAQSGINFAALASGTGGRDDDVRSEASSDLFEIESLSTSTHPLFTIEGSESATTASGYETSEASLLQGCASEKAIDVTWTIGGSDTKASARASSRER